LLSDDFWGSAHHDLADGDGDQETVLVPGGVLQRNHPRSPMGSSSARAHQRDRPILRGRPAAPAEHVDAVVDGEMSLCFGWAVTATNIRCPQRRHRAPGKYAVAAHASPFDAGGDIAVCCQVRLASSARALRIGS
jgi:hypothetical protein